MQRYFFSLSELEQFTYSLDCLSPDNQCQHCSRNDQWVSHGYVYKQTGEKIGKRLLCAKRYNKQGCGRTRQLYLQNIIPQRRYPLSTLLTFILSLIRGATVEQAYFRAIGHEHSSHRQAWRWLDALWRRIGWFRSRRPETDVEPVRRRSRRLSLLLSTLNEWWHQCPDKNGCQRQAQQHFC